MLSDHRAADCLADIVDNIERIEGYVSGLDRDAFEHSGLTRDAVERCLERVCEAGFRLGERAPALMHGQPWGEIRGMGNQLRHAYHRISSEVVWGVVQNRLPGLKASAKQALAQLEGGTSHG